MSRLSSLFQDVYNAADEDDQKQRVRRLWDMAVGSVHLVDRGANKRRFLIRKSEDGGGDDDLFGDVIVEKDGDLSFSVLDENPQQETSAAVDALTEVTERSLLLLKSAQEGTINETEFAAEANAIGQALAAVSPSPTKEEAVKTTEIDTIKMAIDQAKSPQKCAYCDKAAEYGLVYNEGKEFIPCCGGHVMQATNDLKAKNMKVEEKLTMPTKGKEEDAEKAKKKPEEDEEEKGKKADTKKADGPSNASVAARIMKSADDMAIEIEKAGRKMSKARVAKLKSALVKLLELAKELDPSEAQDILNASITKRLDDVEGVEDGAETETAKSADPDKIGDGKSTDSTPTDVEKGEAEESAMWGLNLNDPSLHEGSADKDTSFFD